MMIATAVQSRVLVIGEHAATERWLAKAPALQPLLEIATARRARCAACASAWYSVVVTSPETPVAEDLELLDELRDVRPGLKAIVLAPAATPHDVIAAFAPGCLRVSRPHSMTWRLRKP